MLRGARQWLYGLDDFKAFVRKAEVRRQGVEQSNASTVIGDSVALKLIRRADTLCSFDSAAWSSLLQAESVRPGASEEPVAQAMDWRDGACEAFLAAYGQVIDCLLTALYRQETFYRLVTVFLIEKACYEIAYEAAHRPSWLVVPLWGLISLLATEELETDGTPG